MLTIIGLLISVQTTFQTYAVFFPDIPIEAESYAIEADVECKVSTTNSI